MLSFQKPFSQKPFVFKKHNFVFLLFVVFVSFSLEVRSEDKDKVFDEALKAIQSHYYDSEVVDSGLSERNIKHCKKEMQYSSKRGLVCLTKKVKDPYTKHLSPKLAKQELNKIKTVTTGLGLVLDPIKSNEILAIQKNSPAAESELKVKDLILAVNEVPVEYLTEKELNNLINNADTDTETLLDIQRGYEFFTVSVQAKELPSLSTRYKLLQDQILYIKIDDLLSKKAPDEVKNILLSNNSNQSNGLIIDLRSNKGGLLKNGLKIADLFVSKGKLLTIKTHKGLKHIVAQEDKLYSEPIVVLVDKETASSGEVIASALKDNNVAVLVGTKTFGKGLIQKIKTLSDGSSLHVTVGKFYTPKGQAINKVGIQPNIYIPNTELQLQAAIDYLKTIYSSSV